MAQAITCYYTYILECSDGSFYVGKTQDLDNRLKQHNGILHGGARYTSYRRPVSLAYFEKYETHKLAFLRELRLKKLKHNQKKDLIEGKRTY
jgi:putative endonuclease